MNTAIEHLPIGFREAKGKELHLVMNSWLKTYRKAWVNQNTRTEIFMKGHKTILDEVLKRARTIIAFHKEDPDTIFGWIATESEPGARVIHYIYVKEAFRRMGIGAQLLKVSRDTDEPLVYTHSTPMWEMLARAESLCGEFNPYLFKE